MNLDTRNPLAFVRDELAPWLADSFLNETAVGQFAAKVAKEAPIGAPTVGEVIGEAGKAILGGELFAAMQELERDPTVMTDLMPGMMSSPIAYPMAAMTVYHGSPHKFDKFDLSKIGTGEGAQAYGHGMYFAENPKIAGNYAEKLSDQTYRIDGILMPGNADPVIVATQIQSMGGADKAKAYFLEEATKAADLAAQSGSKKMADTAANFQKWAGMVDDVAARKFEVQGTGALYEVDIPDELIEGRLLDWESEVPESIRKPISEAMMARFGSGASKTSGEQLYKQIQWEFKNAGSANPAQDASDFLKSIGIPGIRYLDAGSRGAGEGTRNLVIWAQDILDKAKVLRK